MKDNTNLNEFIEELGNQLNIKEVEINDLKIENLKEKETNDELSVKIN